jgi:hypothetical protein
MEALDFRIEVADRVTGGYRIHVRTPDEVFTSIIPLDFDDEVLRVKLSFLPTILRSSSAKTRAAVSAEEEHVQYIGSRLFNQLTAHETLGMLTSARRKARDSGRDLRITLRIRPAELAALPWEFLYDARSDRNEYLGRQCLVVRHTDDVVSRPALRVPGPLRILAVAALPTDLPRLDVEAERRRLELALADLTARRMIDLRWIEGTWHNLLNSLNEGPWHVLHFIGHGLYDEAAGEGKVAFMAPGGGSDYLLARQLAATLATHATLRLAVFNACETGRGGTDPQSSIAAAMLHSGISALVSMQFPVTDVVAIAFSRAFYESLANGLPVDRCVQTGRSAIWLTNAHSLEWGTPMLHVRTAEGRLFDRVAAEERRSPGEKPPRQNDGRPGTGAPPKADKPKPGASAPAGDPPQSGLAQADKLFAASQSRIQGGMFTEAVVRDLTRVVAEYEAHYGAEHFWSNAARTALTRAGRELAKQRNVRVPPPRKTTPRPPTASPGASDSGSPPTGSGARKAPGRGPAQTSPTRTPTVVVKTLGRATGRPSRADTGSWRKSAPGEWESCGGPSTRSRPANLQRRRHRPDRRRRQRVSGPVGRRPRRRAHGTPGALQVRRQRSPGVGCDGSGSTGGDYPIEEHTFLFHDDVGLPQSVSQSTPTYDHFPVPHGTYTVTLVVTDTRGNESQPVNETITV